MNSVQLIVPAAGFGKRVGAPQSKEMFLNPKTQKPLIQSSLDLAVKNNFDYHLITRKEKQNLIEFVRDYADKNQLKANIQIIEPQGEWPATVLASKDFWQESNILFLPDTEFEPIEILDNIKNSLILKDLSFACFEVENGAVWGCLKSAGPNSFKICEKPQEKHHQFLAWGLIGFKKQSGETLFKSLEQSNRDHLWKALDANIEILNLKSFKDLTRG